MTNDSTEKPWKAIQDHNSQFGVWLVCDDDVFGEIARVRGNDPAGNAKKMAAAPDMLAALKAALEQTEDGLHECPCEISDCWVSAAEAAIAKAVGQ